MEFRLPYAVDEKRLRAFHENIRWVLNRTSYQRPDILHAAANGEYQIVYVTAKFIYHPASKWFQIVDTLKRGSTTFAKNLVCVAVDEVHLVRWWKGLREDYKKIGTSGHDFQRHQFWLFRGR
ncbi:hypothetical protein FPQ18DRAFT_307170 [Pyronema domesticum]|nr:hypothetical protein FPQ18DRAFT_307170 [Pyronema domesticum]